MAKSEVRSPISKQLIAAARELSTLVETLKFGPPVTHTYNPLTYAWPAHEEYLRRFGGSRKRVVFLGMNPGPFGMVQIGIPFGEIAAARDWMGIRAPLPSRPRNIPSGRSWVLIVRAPKSAVAGFGNYVRNGLVRPEKFFAEHFVVNYCPLAFLEASGLQPHPQQAAPAERERLFQICDDHLRRVLAVLQPEWLIGIGGFARERAELASASTRVRVGQILHPSPASPKANRHDWTKTATQELIQLGVWK